MDAPHPVMWPEAAASMGLIVGLLRVQITHTKTYNPQGRDDDVPSQRHFYAQFAADSLIASPS